MLRSSSGRTVRLLCTDVPRGQAGGPGRETSGLGCSALWVEHRRSLRRQGNTDAPLGHCACSVFIHSYHFSQETNFPSKISEGCKGTVVLQFGHGVQGIIQLKQHLLRKRPQEPSNYPSCDQKKKKNPIHRLSTGVSI